MNRRKWMLVFLSVFLLAGLLCVPAMAAGDVAGAVEQTWTDASGQIKTVVDSVVFPRSKHGDRHRLLREISYGLL